MSSIDLKNIARLARLRFKDEELKVFEPQISGILDFVEQLKGVNVEGVEPTSHPLSLQNVFREDKVVPSLPTDKFISKAPVAHGRFFDVPKIIEDKS